MAHKGQSRHEGTEVGWCQEGAWPFRSSSLWLGGHATERGWGVTGLLLKTAWTPEGILTGLSTLSSSRNRCLVSLSVTQQCALAGPEERPYKSSAHL